MVLLTVIILIWFFGIWTAYAEVSEPEGIQLNVTTDPFVDYGEDPRFINRGRINASETKGICSVGIDIEGYTENVRKDESEYRL